MVPYPSPPKAAIAWKRCIQLPACSNQFYWSQVLCHRDLRQGCQVFLMGFARTQCPLSWSYQTLHWHPGCSAYDQWISSHPSCTHTILCYSNKQTEQAELQVCSKRCSQLCLCEYLHCLSLDHGGNPQPLLSNCIPVCVSSSSRRRNTIHMYCHKNLPYGIPSHITVSRKPTASPIYVREEWDVDKSLPFSLYIN